MNKEMLQFIKEIASEAGDILLEGFRNDKTEISYKSRTDLVTNFDRKSEEYLVDKIHQKYPDHSIIAEEGNRKELSDEYIWYVDPLDGTNNYAHGIPNFCVSIAVFSKEHNGIIAGVIFDPYHDELFSAVKGDGAHLNEEKISVSEINDIGIAVLATGFPYDKENNDKNNLKEFNRVLPKIQGIRRMGSAALDLSYVASGRFDGYWESGIKEWDVAAGIIIVQEAGGSITRYNGSPFDLNRQEILASNGKIHKSIGELLTS